MPPFPTTSEFQNFSYSKTSSDISIENTSKEVVIAVDATKDPGDFCFIWALQNILEPGDHVTFLGILHRINTPMGYKSQANLSSFVGTNKKTMEQETEKTLWHFEQKLRLMSDWCDRKGIYVDITITAGSPLKTVLLQEALNMKATHVVLDRNLRKDRRYYQERIKCILVTFSQDNEVEYLRVMYGPFILDNPRRPVWKVKATDSSALVRCTPESVANSITFDSDINLFSDPSNFTGETSTPMECLSSTNEVERCFPVYIEDLVSPSMGSLSSSLNNNPPSEETSFIDLLMMDCPEGIKPVWSHAEENENKSSLVPEGEKMMRSNGEADENISFSAFSLNCDEPRLETVFTSTKVPTSPLEDKGLGITPATVENMTASSSAGIQREINPICTRPTRTFPLLLELLKDHDFQSIEDTDANESEGKLEALEDVNKQEENLEVHESELPSLALIGTVEIFRKGLANPPPLCSVCKLKSPELGKAIMIFQYDYLRAATNDFSTDNLIAEGGFGLVYKGTLQEELIVAVKVLKASSLQGDAQFSAEVEALSCAQHRNLIRLIGYCVELDRRALVYEYVCNGSLDRHLSGRGKHTLEWSSRHKIAVGAARGLRYLHEECRAGCIVHRDMRPNNILLTHDFTPMVGDFGLAKLSSNGDVATQTQVIGSLGYLAPEYVDCGQVTTKTDVYSFGIVLLELISGRKAVDLLRPAGEVSLIEWARPKIEWHKSHELVDPNIAESVDVCEYNRMVKAASLCIKKDPTTRPGISQILRILEGDFDAFRYETARDFVPNSNAVKLACKNQDQEDINCRKPTEQSGNFHRTTRSVTAAPRALLEWVRTR